MSRGTGAGAPTDVGLSGMALKLLAMGTMLIDHLGYLVFNDLYWMRAVGRISFPIFVFLLVEGFAHTKSIGRYALRLGLFALLAEPCFDYSRLGIWLEWGHQNIFFTLLLGLLGLWALKRLGKWGVLVALGLVLAGDLLSVDYGTAGVLLIVLMGALRQKRWGVGVALVVFSLVMVLPNTLWALTQTPIQWALLPSVAGQLWGLVAIVPLARYNGQRGGVGWPRWSSMAFYAFYPLHLLAIGLFIHLR